MSSIDDITKALDEIVPFLDVLTPSEYKSQVLEHILGMTGTQDGIQALCQHEKLLDKVADLACNEKDVKIQHDCIKLLVNLTSANQTALLMSKIIVDYFIEFMLRLAKLPENESSDSVTMLLTNMSQNEVNAKVIAKFFIDENDINLKDYIDIFCNETYNKHCDLHYLGSFLANLTVIKDFRFLFLQNDLELLQRILPFTEYEKSAIRRQAGCRIIKNCLFETEFHERMLSDECDMITHLLLPLAGPEELKAEENDELPLDLQYLPPDKQREQNVEIQLLLLECLFQLCATKSCRLKMKNNGSYYILREFHSSVDGGKNEQLDTSLENIIQVLIGDEPDKGMENLRDVEIPVNIKKKLENVS